MRLAIKRSGGMIGLVPRPPNHIDTAELAIEARERVYRLVAAARVHELPQRLARVNPDETAYELAITHDDGTQQTVEFTHAVASPELRALVAEVNELRKLPSS
jgi:hypothetical protein